MKFDRTLAVFCVDVGSIAAGNFGWAGTVLYAEDLDIRGGTDIMLLADAIAERLDRRMPVALGFECPLFVPKAEDPRELTSKRDDEGNKAWSSSPGSAVLATGLTETVWILRRIHQQLSVTQRAYIEWPLFAREREGLFLWEAFVSGAGKGQSTSHTGDAQIAVRKFTEALPHVDEANAVNSDEVHSLVGAALLRTGWTTDLSVLSKPCLVIKA